jgi:monoamine oxidase
MRADVVVVGAGMAGLTCALDLKEAGADVVVLEAGRRPGGRVRTVTFDDGRWVESGGEWIDTAHQHVHRLLDRFGLGTVGDAEPWWEREAGWVDDAHGLRPAADVWTSDPEVRAGFASFDLALSVVAGSMPDPSRPDLHPDAGSIDARSAADLFDELDLTEFARFFLTRSIEFEYTCQPAEISVLFLAQQRAVELSEERTFGVVRSQRVAGGLSRLARAVAAELGDSVRFGEPLTALRHDDGGVTAVSRSVEIQAMQAVLALPLPPLRSVTVAPAFEGAFGDGVARLAYGAVTKTFVRSSVRPPFPWAVTGRFLQRVYDATEDQPGEGCVLDAYVGGDGARELDASYPDAADRVSYVAKELEAMLPQLGTLDPKSGRSRSWTAHPHFGGSFSLWKPGFVTSFWQALREPYGRIHLAGEHVATVCGYVEGAVESGHRVAERLVNA